MQKTKFWNLLLDVLSFVFAGLFGKIFFTQWNVFDDITFLIGFILCVMVAFAAIAEFIKDIFIKEV